jgi:outer membrane receptor protein involved in Fe transport
VIDNYIHVTNNVILDKGYFYQLADESNYHILNPTIITSINNSTSIHTSIPYNDKNKSYIWGFEFEHQLGLSFLPWYLSNLNLSYNFSITKSITHIIVGKNLQTTYYDTLRSRFPPYPITQINSRVITTNYYGWEKRVSEGQPETYGNVALGYDLGGFSGRLSMYYQGKYTKTFSSLGQEDIVVDEFTKLDLSLKQEVIKNVFLFLNVNNLTNQKETTSMENTVTLQGIKEWSAPYSSEFYGRTMDFGIRIIL